MCFGIHEQDSSDIAKRALMEAEAGFDARAEAYRARQQRPEDEYEESY